MFDPVVTRDPTAVQVEVQKAYLGMFPGGEKLFVPRVFGWAIECFTGHYPEYLAVDARYHDFEHTLQGTLCLARLLACRHQAGAKPVATEKLFQLAIVGILLHDTGYLKRRDDVEGTGAKYTATHVYRSADFALRLLAGKGFTREEIASVQNMIRCTGVDAMLHEIPFQSKLEEVLGHALGTADLLGQMAAEDYVEKLPVLYAEFVEAAKHDRGHTDFISKFGGEHDLMQRTPSFWQDYVKPKLDRDFDGLHRYLNQPYPNGKNWYVDCIEANMVKLREHLAARV
ncbi:MAG: hypothetical protein HOP33_21820 [Verrucomicrobia bacterium]|nr:hypothetical protein [Verrucomicrobiota bacterium]